MRALWRWCLWVGACVAAVATVAACPHRRTHVYRTAALREWILAATKTTTLRYGGQLQHPSKFDDTIDYSNTIGYDTTAYPEKWESVTHSVHAPPASAKPTEFSTSFRLGETEFTNPDKADEYRRTW